MAFSELMLVAAIAAPESSKRPRAEAAAAEGDMEIDGRLAEEAWAEAAVQTLGFQKTPRYDDPPAQRTRFVVLANEETVYFGIRCDAADGVPIAVRRTRRDRDIEADRVIVDIDSRGLGIDAFHFEVTAGGSLVDGIRYNDTTIDRQWDGVWTAAVTVDDGGWTAELAIPVSQLRRPAGSKGPLGLQVRRYTTALGERDEWARTPRDGSAEVSRYGHLVGVDIPERTFAVEFLPYGSLGFTAERGTDVSPAMVRRTGADLRLRLGSDFTLEATALPDFGTVEADTARLNLRTVELQFPEKRPFFLEGVDLLQTPLNSFYSRRIGSLSGRTVGNAVGATTPARILAATKLLGRAGPRWSVAAVGAVTEAQQVVVRDPDIGVEAPQRTVPAAAFGLVRVRRTLPNAGFVAGSASTRSGLGSRPEAPWTACPSGDAPVRNRCLADVHVLSTDARVRSRNGIWVGTGQLLGSFRNGGPPEVGLDGNQLASGDMGGASRVQVAKTGGQLLMRTYYEWLGRDADWNAVGFVQRPNRHSARTDIGVQWLTPHGLVLEDRWQVEVFQHFTLDGLPNGSGYQANYKARWRSMWTSFFELHWRPAYYDIRETRDGRPYKRAGLLGAELEFKTDSRRKVIASFESTGQLRTTGPRFDGELNIDANPSGAVQLRIGATTTIDRGEPRWLETVEATGDYRFAPLFATALGLVGRLNVTFPGNVELQTYAQILGVQTRFGPLLGAPASAPRIFQAMLQRVGEPAPLGEREAILLTNIFLRWEYRTGSNLWLVVTRNPVQSVFDDAAGSIDLRRATTLPAAWLAMVKVTRLLGASRAAARTRRRRR